jgi:hypothetical protein
LLWSDVLQFAGSRKQASPWSRKLALEGSLFIGAFLLGTIMSTVVSVTELSNHSAAPASLTSAASTNTMALTVSPVATPGLGGPVAPVVDVRATWPPGWPAQAPRDPAGPSQPLRRGCAASEEFSDACFFSDLTFCVGLPKARTVGLVVEEGDPLLAEPWRVDKTKPGFVTKPEWSDRDVGLPLGVWEGLRSRGSDKSGFVGIDPERRWPAHVYSEVNHCAARGASFIALRALRCAAVRFPGFARPCDVPAATCVGP